MQRSKFSFVPGLFALALLVISGPASPAEESQDLLEDGLQGWSFYTEEGQTEIEEGWTLEEGVLKTPGLPLGYLITNKEFQDYTLQFDWQWGDEEGGNSGLLISAIPAQEGFNVWPLCLEVQLKSGSAGDFYFMGRNVGGTVTGEVTKHVGIPLVHAARQTGTEKPVGEWNTMRVESREGSLKVYVNDELVNEISDLKPTRGKIAFQAEEAPIHFRNISVTNH